MRMQLKIWKFYRGRILSHHQSLRISKTDFVVLRLLRCKWKILIFLSCQVVWKIRISKMNNLVHIRLVKSLKQQLNDSDGNFTCIKVELFQIIQVIQMWAARLISFKLFEGSFGCVQLINLLILSISIITLV